MLFGEPRQDEKWTPQKRLSDRDVERLTNIPKATVSRWRKTKLVEGVARGSANPSTTKPAWQTRFRSYFSNEDERDFVDSLLDIQSTSYALTHRLGLFTSRSRVVRTPAAFRGSNFQAPVERSYFQITLLNLWVSDTPSVTSSLWKRLASF